MRLFYYTCLFVLVFAACKPAVDKSKQANAGNKGPIAIDASIAVLSPFQQTVEANGIIQSNQQVDIQSELSARVVSINIPEGKMVKAGTLLVKLYDDDLQAQLRKVSAQLNIAQGNEKRLKTLYDVKGINQQDYEAALSQKLSLEADLDYIKSMIKKTEIRAPFDGMIGLRRISLGAMLTPQTIITTLQEQTQLKVDFVLPEQQASTLKVGNTVQVKFNQGQTVAKVIAIEPRVESGTQNVQVRAMIQSAESHLSPGAFVKVVLDVAKNKASILVPTQSVIPDARNKKIAVIHNGVVQMTVVETGYRGTDNIEIVSGLNVGDTFAVSGILYLKPKAEVSIQKFRTY
jgi:membrane fusion protein (multidrug efflux system)